ncbi:MAG: helix-turn-helix domain-containing protein [Pontiella sp.]
MKQAVNNPNLEIPINLEKTVGEFERNLIVQALEKCDGIQTRAAKRLGTTRRILRYRMDKLGIPVPPQKHS